MKGMRKATAAAIVVLTVMSAVSCSLPAKGKEDGGERPEKENMEQVSELFKEENGSYVFETNDERYSGGKGKTLWTMTSADKFEYKVDYYRDE